LEVERDTNLVLDEQMRCWIGVDNISREIVRHLYAGSISQWLMKERRNIDDLWIDKCGLVMVEAGDE
jgi:hypothetical protein